MAVATDEDRKFMAEQGFKLIGDTFTSADGRSIVAVWVNLADPRQGTFMGAPYGNRVVMWHAARTTGGGDEHWATRPVGSPCDSPIACFVQAEVALWGR